MRGVFIAAGVALAVSILLTPYLIRFFARQGFGQEIRAEGPSSHQAKRGTPTMGGVAILIAIWLGYLVSHLLTGEPITLSALLVLFLTTALGAVGFLDDFLKYYSKAPNFARNLVHADTVTVKDIATPGLQLFSYLLTNDKAYGMDVFRMAPVHHHFEQLGWSESKVVIRFWIVAIVLALIGLATLKLR